MRWIVPLLLAIAPAQAPSAESFATSSGDRVSYVLLPVGANGSMMSGSSYDFERSQAYRAGNSALLYVREHGAAYVIRDPALLRRAEGSCSRSASSGPAMVRWAATGRARPPAGEPGRGASADRTHDGGCQGAGNELGRQQGALGREQARLAEAAQPQFRDLVAEAIQRGLARRVN